MSVYVFGPKKKYELTLRGWTDEDGRISPGNVMDILQENTVKDLLEFDRLHDEAILRQLEQRQRKGAP